MKLRIGTRGSKLALRQTEIFLEKLLLHFKGIETEIIKISTKGDKLTDVPLAKIGSKGIFVKEIEEALLRKEIDIAVHSLKDMPSEVQEGLVLAGVLKRESPADAFISSEVNSLHSMGEGDVIGTSSLRRKVIIKKHFPHIKVEELRGNLDTRIRKMKEGRYKGIIVSYAGLIRMGWEHEAKEILPIDLFVPACGQGVIGIECRREDEEIINLIGEISDNDTMIEIKAERTFLKELGGGCQVPLGVNARIKDGKIFLIAFISSLDAERFIQIKMEGEREHPEELGKRATEAILKMGGKRILEEIYGRN